MAIADDFKARFPEFDAAIVDQYLPVLEGVWPIYYAEPYSDETREIVLSLLAHLLVVQTSPGSDPALSVTSASADGVSVSYESGEGYGFFGSTKYGQMYMLLLKARDVPRAYFV